MIKVQWDSDSILPKLTSQDGLMAQTRKGAPSRGTFFAQDGMKEPMTDRRSSCTWFNAVVLTPVGHDRVPRREIGKNPKAIPKSTKLEVSWDQKAASADGELEEWLSNIRGGDMLQVIPKAVSKLCS